VVQFCSAFFNSAPLSPGAVYHSLLVQYSTAVYILELCLEGHLARNGFIDKDLLWEGIKKVEKGHNTKFLWPLDHLLSLEAFLTYWE